MKHSVSVTSSQKDVKISPAFRARLKRAVKKALVLQGFSHPAFVSVSIVTSVEIQRLNLEFREKNAPTDVLSFPALEDINNITPADMDFSRGGEVFLGDIILCAEVIKNQAPDFSHSFEEECVYMTVHSVLHLLGYDHMVDEERKEMFKIQDEIFKIIEEEEKNEK